MNDDTYGPVTDFNRLEDIRFPNSLLNRSFDVLTHTTEEIAWKWAGGEDTKIRVSSIKDFVQLNEWRYMKEWEEIKEGDEYRVHKDSIIWEKSKNSIGSRINGNLAKDNLYRTRRPLPADPEYVPLTADDVSPDYLFKQGDGPGSMTPWKHAESSARKWGGKPNDYITLHDWFDETKQFTGDWTHRALRHHSAGIQWAIEKFGHTVTNNLGQNIPIKILAEQHIMEDCGFIPTPKDYLSVLAKNPADWMLKVQKEKTIQLTLN